MELSFLIITFKLVDLFFKVAPLDRGDVYDNLDQMVVTGDSFV